MTDDEILRQLPDGRVISFPAGTSDEVIASTARRMMAESNPQPEPEEEEGVFSRALSNTPASAWQFAKDMAQPIIHPIDTATSLIDLGTGIIQLAIPGEQGNEEMARAVGEYFADRYGGIDNIKETFAKDPVGFLGDASVILTGGGTLAARSGGTLSKAGNIARRVGRAIDPATNVAKAAKASARVVGNTLANIGGVSTGVGTVPIIQAYRAGRAGGEASDLLREQMRGTGSNTSTYERAINGLQRVRDERSAIYRQGLSEIDMNARINPYDIIEPYQRTMEKYVGGTARNPEFVKGGAKFADKLEEIDALMRRWGMDPEMHTLAYADDLKRQLDTLWEPDNVTGAVVSEVRGGVRNAIEQIDPRYADVMADYQTLTDDIEHLRTELSLSSKNPSTVVRKLQGGTRNNVNTAYGSRVDLINELDPNLLPELSGQALNQWMPRGLAQGVGAGSIATTGFMGGIDPLTAAIILGSQSPRIVGEVAHAVGRVGRVAAPAAGVAFDAARNIRPLEQAIMEQEERKRLGLPPLQ
jgi:hypothetical protein